MKKGSLSFGNFPSPGGPISYGVENKGWSSERVPHPSSSSSSSSYHHHHHNTSRRHISAANTPFYSGRALPSKWEDAERWICSPPVLSYSGYNVNSSNTNKGLQPLSQQRRPKSKSGPIVQQQQQLQLGGYSSYSASPAAIQGLDGIGGASGVRHLFAGSSPFSTGVLVPDGVALHYGVGGSGAGVINVARLGSLPGWSDLVSESSLPSSPDEKLEEMKDAETMVSAVPSRRDMATQMSPERSTHSSPGGRSSMTPSPPSILPIVESRSDLPAKVEIREVQVDKRATIISWSKRHGSKSSKKRLPDIEDFFQNATGDCTSSWDITDTAISISRLQREEAKIAAWEHLQKAKAEAAVRKLEMKLEKKRSSSMDKILNKLRTAQLKAQEMRNSMSVRQGEPTSKITQSHKSAFLRKHIQFRYFGSCITCHKI